MNLELIRYNHDVESTQGLIALDGSFECHALEDQRQEVKVAGETRVTEGRYEMKLRKVLSGLTKKYRKKFDWFTWHIEIVGIPGFKYVYIHIGNEDDHSDACVLVADRAWNDPNDYKAYQTKSTEAYKRLYQKVVPFMEAGGRAFIDIKSIWE